jgi:uncharacterized Tic20 family protein
MSQTPDQPVDPTTPYGQQPPPPPPPYGQAPYGQAPYGQQPYPPQPQPYGAPQGYWTPGVPGQLRPDERTWGSAAHWSALVASLVALAFLGPLLVLLTKGAESAYVRRQAVESLNFQLSMLIYIFVSLVLMFVLVGFLLVPIVGIAWLVLTIVGAVKSSNGEEYRYPLTIRMVS